MKNEITKVLESFENNTRQQQIKKGEKKTNREVKQKIFFCDMLS